MHISQKVPGARKCCLMFDGCEIILAQEREGELRAALETFSDNAGVKVIIKSRG